MKIRLIHNIVTICLTLLLSAPPSIAEGANGGVPFIRSYNANEYDAHNRNFDIACDTYGTVFVANFAGLLYYDGSMWRKIPTPGTGRVTRMARAANGCIWVGGYNVFGYLDADARGRLMLRTVGFGNGKEFRGEVDIIKVSGDKVYIHTSAGEAFGVDSKYHLQRVKRRIVKNIKSATDSINNIALPGMNVSVRKADGLDLRFAKRTRHIGKQDGLCSNTVNFITFDKHHTIWGATDHGLFAIEAPSPFSCLTEAQGLHGEVYSIGMTGNDVYFGTLQGLYRLSKGILTQVKGVESTCWQLLPIDDGTLLAATVSGLYRITPQGLSKITAGGTQSVCKGRGNVYYTGEIDGVYEVTFDGMHRPLAKIEKCVSVRNAGDRLRVETLFGERWEILLGDSNICRRLKRAARMGVPKIDFLDAEGRHWLTDADGKHLKVRTGGKADSRLTSWTNAVGDRSLNAIYVNNNRYLWVGGEFGAISFDMSAIDNRVASMYKSNVYIRQIVAYDDSVLWGGYRQGDCKPLRVIKNIDLPSSCNSLTVYFSAGAMSVFHPTKYRYRLNDGRWSAWSEDNYVRFGNMQYGPAHLEIQALDLFGNVSETASVEWYLNFPFYLRWWAILFYVVVVSLMVRAGVIIRMKKLRRDKQMLEQTVSERTAELSTALDDLQRMQADLMRMERTATAGKLTQGLIDRILNPINYINNFSKLTFGLAKDLKEDIDNEKENMSAENYEDCQDIIGMMQTNLTKIEEHGVNTTRTLRAMEAMLKNQIGKIYKTDMTAICRQALEMTKQYHKKSIEECKINMLCKVPKTPLMHDVDADAINRTLIALLTNAIYAVVKKYQREKYAAEVSIQLSPIGESHLEIVVHDNGVGIEDAIIDKVFDPFFTTKPTSEAAGVGLYLAREIIQDHNGTITLRTEKDVFTDFVISL